MKYKDKIAVVAMLISFVGISIAIVFWIKIDTGFEPIVALLAVIVTGVVALLSGVKDIIEFIQSLISKVEGKRVFVSYPFEYEEDALQIVNNLRKSGAKVWIASEQLKPGEVISETIEKAIYEAEYFVVLITNKSDSYIHRELEIAYQSKKRIIPVLLEKAEIPTPLRDIQYVDFQIDRQKALENLRKAIV